MKKIFMLLASCLFFGCIMAQPANNQPRNRHKTGDNMLKSNHSLRIFNEPHHRVGLHGNNYSDAVVKYRLDSVIIKYDEMLTGNYTNGEKGEYFYNEDYQLISTQQKSWSGIWIDSWKDDYYYNQMGLSDSVLSYEYTGGQWQQYFKEKRTYNPDSTLQSLTYYNWDWTSFVPSQKVEYQYTGDSIVENWYTYENGWINDYIVTFYLTDDRITSEISKSIYATGQMQNEYKADYLYYANGDLQERLVSYWEESSWTIPLEKESYTYDSFNNLEQYSWSMLGENGWEVGEETLPEYNNQFTRDDLIIPAGMDEEIFFRHMLTRSVDNSYDMGELQFSIEINPYYTPVIVEKAKNMLTLQSTVFPNPATDNITIRWDAPVSEAKLTVYNQVGSHVTAFNITNNTTIPTAGLKPGLYLYTLTGEKGVNGSGKFVVK